MKIVRITDEQQIFFVGKMIYQTDPYIYPALFASEMNAVKVVRELLNIPHDIFCSDNIYIAQDFGKNLGMMCAYSNQFDSSYDCWLEAFGNSGAFIPNTFQKAYNQYIYDLSQEKYNGIYISNICVDESCRNQGIGYKMLYEFCKMQNNELILLDVLKDNINAVNLYRRIGFTVSGEYDGFSLGRNKPRCYHMVKHSK